MSTSAHSAIRDILSITSQDRWGWVIYRCTYADDETWARFRAGVEAHSREDIAQSDAPEIADRLEWTWVEDAASLDEISTSTLREKFRTWAVNEVERQHYDASDDVRFRYFVKIDQEVLQSFADTLSSDGLRWSPNAFIKFVDGDWEPSPAIAKQEEDEDEFGGEEEFEPIEGCTEKNVGWMRILPIMINAEFYNVLDSCDDQWPTFYQRPPTIVEW
jgi:hypothetical protein